MKLAKLQELANSFNIAHPTGSHKDFADYCRVLAEINKL